MRATEFEFRHRFWIITITFWAGFLLYFIDPVNSSVALAHSIHRTLPNLSSDKLPALVRALFAAGATLVALGALLRSWAEAYLHGDVVHDSEVHSEALVADGPYRHVRNPLYLGILLMAAGMGLAASRAGWVVLVGVLTLFSYRLILREENGLLQTQGQAYRTYCAAVPRLWPSLRPCVPSGSLRPRWAPAFAGETFMWIFALAMAAFAVTLRMAVIPWVVGAGLAVYVLQNFVFSARQRPRSGKPPATPLSPS